MEMLICAAAALTVCLLYVAVRLDAAGGLIDQIFEEELR